MTASVDRFGEIPATEQIVDRDGRPTLWMQFLWNNLSVWAKGLKSGTGSYASTSGVVTIAHGLKVAPSIGSCMVQYVGSGSPIVVTLVSADATNISAKLWVANTGAAVANANYDLAWQARRP